MSRTWKERIGRGILRLALVVLGLLGGLYAVEFGLERTNPYGIKYPAETQRYFAELVKLTILEPGEDLDGTLFVHKPGCTVPFHDFQMHTNASGLRGPEIEQRKPEGTFRYLMLGDSVTLGWGVDDADTFSQQLERALNAKRDDPLRYEVLNAGHLRYDSTQEAAFLRDRGMRLQPDAVVLTFIANDIVEPTRRWAEFLFKAPSEPVVEPSFTRDLEARFRRHFPATWQFAALFLEQLSEPSNPYTQVADEGGAVDGESPLVKELAWGWERSKRALRDIRDRCRAAGIPFLVLDQAVPRLADHLGPEFSLVAFCRAEGIPLHDLRYTQQERAQDIVNSRMDPHANRLGNTFMLQKLQRALAAEGLPSGL